MPLKNGHSKEVVNSNIKEMVAAGHPVKNAVAASLAMARKSKKMAMGGMVDDDEGSVESAGEPVYPENDDAEGLSDSVMDAEMGADGLQARKMKANDNSVSYQADDSVAGSMMSKSGLKQADLAQALGNKPDLGWINDGTGEPMGDEPDKPTDMEHSKIEGVPMGMGLSSEAMEALKKKKNRRQYF